MFGTRSKADLSNVERMFCTLFERCAHHVHNFEISSRERVHFEVKKTDATTQNVSFSTQDFTSMNCKILNTNGLFFSFYPIHTANVMLCRRMENNERCVKAFMNVFRKLMENMLS